MEFFRITGFREVTEEYRKKQAVYEACVAAGVGVPDEVSAFFLYQKPSGEGYETKLDHIGEEDHEEDAFAVVIDVSQIPEGVRKLRVCCPT